MGDSELTNGHSFLILSRNDSTMVLQTAQEINELDQSGFCTTEPTVYSGNMGGNRFIVQVSKVSNERALNTLKSNHLIRCVRMKCDCSTAPRCCNAFRWSLGLQLLEHHARIRIFW